MAAGRWQLAQEIFQEALARGPKERASFIAEACGDDEDLRTEVESLVAYDQEAPADFMRAPERGSEAVRADSVGGPDPLVGARISRYEIKSVIGTGGMGTVYEAEQENPKRIVALKVMRAGVTSRVALRHFEREAQILARLRHPNIAQVFEAGTHSDAATGGAAVPYFAMEYIPDARPIDRYAREKQLGVRERLGLFAQVCDAVHHGHQKGIIHRDLKPGNILVDSAGLPKVIDFGVARSTDSDIAVTTMRTDVGQLIGTLQYMSPEQCDADPDDLDVRSDVYSLGLVLYELLTGELPYEAGGCTIYRGAKVIKECAPRKPSSINPKLHGDVETITLKALEKDREKRYQSAADLAQDIRRHLHREPIEAKPPTKWARTVRWVSRHPLITTTAAGLGIAAIIVLATTISILLLNFRPHAVSISNDQHEAWLLSFAGRRLHTWRVEEPGGITFAGLVERPPELGGGRLILVGFNAASCNPFPGSLCAFDVVGDRRDPVWHRYVENQDILPRLLEDGVTREGFGVASCTIADVFPEYPGDEIVALHAYGSVGSSVIRVYDLNGEVHYQVGHNGSLRGCHWMSEAQLLLLTGFNSEATWGERGHDEVEAPYPVVAFAVHPRCDFITADCLGSMAGDGPLDPAWYKCLHPPNARDVVRTWKFVSPAYGHDPGRHAYFQVLIPEKGAVRWLIDEFGREVPGTRVVGARYKRAKGLPDPGVFTLGPLPPIVSVSESAQE
ncbi:MAG: serine/threonine protein kinase [Phycisphaerales bacterium]|nr:MAG: serine/threonine protein kinase [Phycisphaerales bacterium]